MVAEREQSRPHFTVFSKEVLAIGCLWSLQIHFTDVCEDTPPEIAEKKAFSSMNWLAQEIESWAGYAKGRAS